MKKGAFDFGHYVPYFVLVLFVSLFLFLYIFHLFGEQEIATYQRYLHLNDIFTTDVIMKCFSDSSHYFNPALFTDDALTSCTQHDARITLENLDTSELKIIGKKDLQPDFISKEYVVFGNSKGVLTIELEN